MYRILQDTPANTQVSDLTTSDFDQVLATYLQHLAAGQAPEAMRDRVADMLSDTGKMSAVTAELSAKLKATTDEVTLLTQNLQRAHTEARLDPLTGLKNLRGWCKEILLQIS